MAAVRATATIQVRTILSRFALVAAALRMAIEAGLLPWTYEDTDLGVAACMVRWAGGRKGRLDLAGELVNVVEQIRGILAANLHGRFIHQQLNEEGALEYANASDETKRDTLGFVKDKRILVEPSAWRTVLCTGFDPEKTARHLRGEGLLHTIRASCSGRKKSCAAGQSKRAGSIVSICGSWRTRQAPGRMRLRRNLLLSSHAVSVPPVSAGGTGGTGGTRMSRAHQGGTDGCDRGYHRYHRYPLQAMAVLIRVQKLLFRLRRSGLRSLKPSATISPSDTTSKKFTPAALAVLKSTAIGSRSVLLSWLTLLLAG